MSLSARLMMLLVLITQHGVTQSSTTNIGCWVMSKDTKMPGGNPQASAKTVAECHAACVNDNTCVAVEWNDAAKSCSTHGTTAATQAETGTALYYLNRVCLGCWTISKNTKMSGGTALTSADTLVKCQAACVDDKTCVAIDWKVAAISCSTHDTTAATQSETGTALYQLNRVCLGSWCYKDSTITDCMNGGTCMEDVPYIKYKCKCLTGFTGQHCEKKTKATRPDDGGSGDDGDDDEYDYDNWLPLPVGGKCPWLYHDGMWACKDQSACVGRWALCNGVRDCMDNSDEDGCQGRMCRFPQKEWFCEDRKQCVLRSSFCNGRVDCNDRSDESVCDPNRACSYSEFRCASFTQCVPLWSRCDGVKDCHDWSDESGCHEWSCLWNQFKCTDRCIDRRLACDGVRHCNDGEDETDCDHWACSQQAVISEDRTVYATSSGFWRCDDKQCIRRPLICNDVYDCDDKSDERHCLCARFCESDCRQRGVGKCDFRCFDNYTLDANFECVNAPGKSAGEEGDKATQSLTMTIVVAVIVTVLLASPIITGYIWWFKNHRVREKPERERKRMYI